MSSIDFWEEGLEENVLMLMHKKKLYPPRLEVTVQMLKPEMQYIKLSVGLEGCRDQCKFQIFLPLGTPRYIILLLKFSYLNMNRISKGIFWFEAEI